MARRGDGRPNIVLITTDQQRGDCLGLVGHLVPEGFVEGGRLILGRRHGLRCLLLRRDGSE